MTIRLMTLICAAAFALTALASAAKPAPTVVHVFVPKIPSGTAVSGNCWTNSIATNRKGAYRCMNGNSISDPCFASTKPNIVVCDADPATGKPGFAMRVSGPLPAELPVNGPVTPWLLKLGDGTSCEPLTGTRALIGKLLISYGCAPPKGHATNAYVGLADTLDMKSPTWYARRVLYKFGDKGPEVVSSERVPIVAVWR